MANRSYLYATDRAPVKTLDRGRRYDGIGEWSWHVPALALLLVSGDTRIGVSVLSASAVRDPSGDLVNVPNLFGTDRSRAIKFLRIVAHLAEEMPDPILSAEVAGALNVLRKVQPPVMVLELVELLEMESDDPRVWLRTAEDLRQNALALGQAVDALPDRVETGARELAAMLDGQGAGPLAALTLGMARNDITRDTAALGLGGVSDVLCVDPVPRGAFLAATAERFRAEVIVPKVTALAPAPDWALVVERTFSDLRDDGTHDRRYAFVLVNRTTGLFGLRHRHAVHIDPEIGSARLTAARLLEWQIEDTRDLRAIAIRPDGIAALTGTGVAEALQGGKPSSALLTRIFGQVTRP
ncbi:hypothetical protein [Jannaschia pohangensis]|uniref:DUF7822 domain-containing protein n=1 Tax=Jannaschia pohangensis TaxID=390807 RepID=A0A1I3GHV4_9RHOB|nr:hypothetical protein [Jannaschia pohangensis]SFI23085.1 hypothetical protein SAMN04488095_0203 [Jannaschia pohangensis]